LQKHKSRGAEHISAELIKPGGETLLSVKNAFSEMLRRVALESTDVSAERIACNLRVTGIDEIGMIAATTNRSTLLPS
jgi:hypothetical protein